MKQKNEEIFHILGYVKTDDPENITPFVDYAGKAKEESKAKINYIQELNKIGFAKRLKIKHGDLPEEKLVMQEGSPDSFKLITQMQVMQNIGLMDILNYE